MARWAEVVNAFLHQDEWGVRELAGAIELPRSAVHGSSTRWRASTC